MKYEDALKTIEAHDPKSDFWSTVKLAVEKQIKKKPKLVLHENRVPGEQEEYYCPYCGAWITWDFKWKWCAECGQSISWSEVE